MMTQTQPQPSPNPTTATTDATMATQPQPNATMSPSASEKHGDEREVDKETENEHIREEESHGTKEGKHKTEEGRYEGEEFKTPPPPPPHPSPVRTSTTLPRSNQQGHVTALKNDQHDERELTLASEGTLKTNIKYPRRTWCHPPLSWSAIGNETAVPDHIEGSRPLFPQPKCRHRKRYPERRPFPALPTPHTPTQFATCSDADSTLAAARAHATPFTTDKSGSENTAHQSNEDHNNNIDTAPYSTTRSHPPLWPIKPTPSTLGYHISPTVSNNCLV
jgi:hypothetical protein